MARPEKLPATVDPGAYFVAKLTPETWAGIENASQFQLNLQARERVEMTLSAFTEALGALPISTVVAAAGPLATSLFEAHGLAASPEAAAIFRSEGWSDSKIHQFLDTIVLLAGAAYHFPRSNDFVRSGVSPLTPLVRGLAHAYFIATGSWPDGVSHSGARNKGRPCFTSFLLACYETLAADQKPIAKSTLLQKAGADLREFINELKERGLI
jgi:hypothetical protein